jgi:hypothetical protein
MLPIDASKADELAYLVDTSFTHLIHMCSAVDRDTARAICEKAARSLAWSAACIHITFLGMGDTFEAAFIECVMAKLDGRPLEGR